MPTIPGIRSCYAKVGRLVYFGRMIDKIRLMQAGKLPPDYHNNLGIGFDGRCCTFLRIDYQQLVARVKTSGADDELLAWAHQQGGERSDDECTIWNLFMMKIGWRDNRTPVLKQRIIEYGLADKHLPIETFFDLNDYDEGRDPVGTQAWLS